jgi:acetoin utilization deacetylase AcuC-like enzyme
MTRQKEGKVGNSDDNYEGPQAVPVRPSINSTFSESKAFGSGKGRKTKKWSKEEIEPVEVEAHLINIQEFSPYSRKKKTLKYQSVFQLKKIMTVHSDNHINAIKKLCAKNAKLLEVKVGGIYSYQSGLKR